jgi:hypothetical protein
MRKEFGKALPPATAEMVKQFYISDEINRMMPGAKDCVSVNLEDIHVQKQLILYNLKEAKYQAFQSLQSYYQKNCVCTIHQNVKLMILWRIGLLLSKDFKTMRQRSLIGSSQLPGIDHV